MRIGRPICDRAIRLSVSPRRLRPDLIHERPLNARAGALQCIEAEFGQTSVAVEQIDTKRARSRDSDGQRTKINVY